ncbi:arginine ABC transporter substrate-binding protein|nr:arginine ABC transporter substrate-binding protein [Candidatus Pantoea persica]
MKKWILAAALAMLVTGAQAADKIRFVSSAAYPPFESLDRENQIVGFDSLIPSLKFRRYDTVISGMDITEERSKQVDFTQPLH